jgi:hypothetical protein
MNTQYVSGRAFEYAVAKLFRDAGWEVARSAGSHSPWDLVCVISKALALLPFSDDWVLSHADPHDPYWQERWVRHTKRSMNTVWLARFNDHTGRRAQRTLVLLQCKRRAR